jgi:hypothetical protein
MKSASLTVPPSLCLESLLDGQLQAHTRYLHTPSDVIMSARASAPDDRGHPHAPPPPPAASNAAAPDSNRDKAQVALDELMSRFCAACRVGACTVALRRCARCHRVYYCSIECQRRHWTKHHRSVCIASVAGAPRAAACALCAKQGKQRSRRITTLTAQTADNTLLHAINPISAPSLW